MEFGGQINSVFSSIHSGRIVCIQCCESQQVSNVRDGNIVVCGQPATFSGLIFTGNCLTLYYGKADKIIAIYQQFFAKFYYYKTSSLYSIDLTYPTIFAWGPKPFIVPSFQAAITDPNMRSTTVKADIQTVKTDIGVLLPIKPFAK